MPESVRRRRAARSPLSRRPERELDLLDRDDLLDFVSAVRTLAEDCLTASSLLIPCFDLRHSSVSLKIKHRVPGGVHARFRGRGDGEIILSRRCLLLGLCGLDTCDIRG